MRGERQVLTKAQQALYRLDRDFLPPRGEAAGGGRCLPMACLRKTDGGNKKCNEKPAPREKRGLFLDSLEPYGEGHTTGSMPKLYVRIFIKSGILR